MIIIKSIIVLYRFSIEVLRYVISFFSTHYWMYIKMNVIFHHPCDKNRNRIRIDYILNGNMCETPKHSEKLLACLPIDDIYKKEEKKLTPTWWNKPQTSIIIIINERWSRWLDILFLFCKKILFYFLVNLICWLVSITPIDWKNWNEKQT